MHFRPGQLSGLVLIEPRVFADERGFFQELFHQGRFAEAGLVVRPFAGDGIRITVGVPEANARVLEVAATLLENPTPRPG